MARYIAPEKAKIESEAIYGEGQMKLVAMVLGLFVVAVTAYAEGGSESTNGGRYQMFANPHANRVYVLDTQTGRVFQLANYKDLGKEIMEEVPYLYGSNKLCTPTDFERSPDKCFSRNYDYLKSLMDMRREQNSTPPPSAPATKP